MKRRGMGSVNLASALAFQGMFSDRIQSCSGCGCGIRLGSGSDLARCRSCFPVWYRDGGKQMRRSHWHPEGSVPVDDETERLE